MSTQPQPDPASQDPHLDAPLDTRLTAYLFTLLDIGEKVARSVGDAADRQAQPPEIPKTDVAEQFERVSRAMRRTILLIRHLNQPGSATRTRTQARKRIIRAVEDAIQRERDPAEAEPLHTEFRERLDDPDLDDEIDTRPVADIITDITRDLGLAHMPGTHPWTRRTPRELKTLTARAAAPTPPEPYNPAPHGPDPGAPPPKHPPKPPDPNRHFQDLVQLAKLLSGP